jgi:hypothetical protein
VNAPKLRAYAVTTDWCEASDKAPTARRVDDSLTGMIERAAAVGWISNGNLHLENTTERDETVLWLRVGRVLRLYQKVTSIVYEYGEPFVFLVGRDDAIPLDEAERILGYGGK